MGFLSRLFGGGNQRQGGGGGGRFRQIFEMAKPQLNLSAEQEQQIVAIFKDFREERHDLKESGGDNMQQGIKDARHEAKEKIMALLNDDQKRIFRENINKWKDQAGA